MKTSNNEIDSNDVNYLKNLRKIYEETRMEGSRIYLRRLLPGDIDEKYFNYYQQSELTKYMYQTPRQITAEGLLQEQQSGQDSGQYHMYGVFDKTNSLCIGNIRVGHMTHTHKISDLAIFIGNSNYLGKGIAQEAIGLGNQLCFEKYDFRKLHSGMFEANIASVKAYLKTGWLVEGRLRGQYWVDEKPMDRICVALFNPKYFSNDFLSKARLISEATMNGSF